MPLPEVSLLNKNSFLNLPKNLYIPPEALRVFLEAFEGPLDLLLYLIKKQNIDICNIPIAEVTRQYMEYITMMEQLRWELAADYLVMAALLAEIKSKMLLPRPKNLFESETDAEVDPRAELVQRLQEYEQFKKAARDIDRLPRIYRDIFPVFVSNAAVPSPKRYPQIDLKDLLSNLANVLNRVDNKISHCIKMETLSVREKMVFLMETLSVEKWLNFHQLLVPEEGMEGLVATFIAVLELLRQQSIEINEIDCFNGFQCRRLGCVF